MIRRLTVDDIDAFRALREEAMRLHPESFGSPEEEQGGKRQLAAYRDILNKDEVWGAFENGSLVGAAGFFIPSHAKSQTCGRVFTLYVYSAHRGKGLGDQLIKHILAIAAKSLNQMHACIMHSAESAIKILHHNGFITVNREHDAFSIGGASYDELLMVKKLKQ